MGKGGQNAIAPPKAADKATVWKSPYNPLDKNAPKLPTKSELKAAIPAHCFERSYATSLYYLFRDLALAFGFAHATSLVLSTEVPPLNEPWTVLAWAVGWGVYAFWQGSIIWGAWVLGHECGHGAFSPNQTFNDIVGYFLHQSLLTPYFAWQYSHAKHHRHTNHVLDGETHVPPDRGDSGLGENLERESLYSVWHEEMGSVGFAAFEVFIHLFLGWPFYLIGYAGIGRLSREGKVLAETGEFPDHFRPNNALFSPKVYWKIVMSTVGYVATIALLIGLSFKYGFLPVLLWYLNPIIIMNCWLVMYTWLHHTDPSVPHYGEGEWTWVRGALATIDRPYGIFDWFHHRIGSTHVVHHLFSELPFYNAWEATQHLKAFLEPKGLYNYNPAPWWEVTWMLARRCHYVDSREGIQYYKSFDDVPLRKDAKKAN